jgi:pyruvate dehydrogenase E1 component
VTSYQQLFREGIDAKRAKRLRGKSRAGETPYVARCFGDDPEALTVAASDYSKLLPYSIREWVAGEMIGLGTDGFGLSEGRDALRRHFEVDARQIAWTTLAGLANQGRLERSVLTKARKKLGILADKQDPFHR